MQGVIQGLRPRFRVCLPRVCARSLVPAVQILCRVGRCGACTGVKVWRGELLRAHAIILRVEKTIFLRGLLVAVILVRVGGPVCPVREMGWRVSVRADLLKGDSMQRRQAHSS